MDLTQHSQQDEALRQADADPATLHTLMRRLAAWIRHEASGDPITPLDLDDLANEKTWTHIKRNSRFGRVDRARHEALRNALLAAMPEPRDGETRGEYAIRLRAAAGS